MRRLSTPATTDKEHHHAVTEKKKTGPRGLGSLIRALSGAGFSEKSLEELEELLLRSDVGANTTQEILTAIEQRGTKAATGQELQDVAAAVVREHLRVWDPGMISADQSLHILLVLGVNGVGKTTTIAKLATWYREQGLQRISLAAGDTFRAAAVRQLQLHGERLGIRVVAQQDGADAAAVLYDALDSSVAREDQLLITDTAGRMHNKKHLVEELAKMNRIIERKAPQARVTRVLVLDSTTGQNALRQAEVFKEAVGVDCAVLTKYDSSARAGIAVPLCRNLEIPVAFLGTGETYADLRPFSVEEYVQEILA